MVGGTVIETIDTGTRVWINCRNNNAPSQTCAIYVERTEKSRSVSEGDQIWWMSFTAYWTPKGSPFEDMMLVKTSGSGVKRPELVGV